MKMTPSKIVCVGRNYAEHARELGNPVPERPLLFFKPPSALLADGAAIVLPEASRQVEYEAEIAVAVGRRLRRSAAAQAAEAIGGIAPANDVTARDLQKSDGQWARAKGFDTFCPVGPWDRGTVAPWTVDRVRELEIVCRVNGAVRQHGYARDMIFDVPTLLSYISHIMTLEPGDLVLTGTPAGVGPLAPGDVVEVEIPGVGAVSNPVRASV